MANNRRNNGPVVVGGEPRIDFLPPETKRQKQNRRQRRSLVALVILVAIICGLGFTSSTALAISSQAALKAEQAKTKDLLSQQQEFAEARTAADGVANIQNARIVATANEIMWSKFFFASLAQLPAGALVTGLALESPSSIEPVPEVSVLLQKSRIASMYLTLEVPDAATADAVMVRLEKVPGYVDATMANLTWDDSLAVYKMEVAVNVSEEALERRFSKTPADDEGESDADAEADTDEDAPADPAPSASPSSSPSPSASNDATNDED